MIFYYSATGNSKHVAEKVQEKHKGNLIDIGKEKSPREYSIEEGETLYFITFNCFWGISKRVEDFILQSTFTNARDIVFILTCGGYLGGGDRQVKDLMAKKNLPKPKIYDLVMVTNYSILHDIPKLEKQKKLLKKAEDKLQLIIEGKARPYSSNFLLGFFRPFVHKHYDKYRSTKNFKVSDSCIACGQCQKDCPVSAIQIQEGKPTWIKAHCDNCLKCLHLCPVEAINYGDETEKRERYSFKKAMGYMK